MLFASALAWSASAAPSLAEPSATRADFALRSGGVTSRLRVQTASVLPGETLELSALDRTGKPLPIGSGRRDRPRAPRPRQRALPRRPSSPGCIDSRSARPTPTRRSSSTCSSRCRASAFSGDALNSYTIGRYPTSDPNSPPPVGFIEVTEANRDTPVSPHFRLGDFLCKESSGWPKYLVLDPRLPAKLEALLERARAAGLHAPTFTVMSGYRTPAYHRAIGDTTTFSRHLWGAAADVFIDADGDGKMDDLDGNGVIDQRDAALLFALADAMDREPVEDWTVGGASAYHATDSHGPFVHVDVRGRAARW